MNLRAIAATERRELEIVVRNVDAIFSGCDIHMSYRSSEECGRAYVHKALA